MKYERLFYWELNKYQILDFNKKNNILILTSEMDWPRTRQKVLKVAIERAKVEKSIVDLSRLLISVNCQSQTIVDLS